MMSESNYIGEYRNGPDQIIPCNNLITWDEEARQLGIISASTGTVEMIMNLDSVEMLITDKMEEGRIYTLDDRGRLDCLIPLAN